MSANIFDIIHIDIWGPISTVSTSGHKYFLSIVDDKSRFTWLHFMKNKSETASLLKSFIAYVQTQFQVSASLLHSKSPYQILYKELPDIQHIRIFGCLCFVSSLPVQRSKLDPRAHKAVFLGYKPGVKGYITLNLVTKVITVSRHVHFHEHALPFSGSTQPIVPSFPTILPTPPVISETEPLPETLFHIPQPISPTQPPEEEPQLRRSHRTRTAQHHSIFRIITATLPLQKLYRYLLSAITEPKTYREAIKHECWQAAINDELKALHNTHTWILTELPANKKTIGCKRDFTVKHKADGSKGFTQTEVRGY
ncbi:peptide transporter PTR2 [Trifolium pratense]|uniref:Peptide transporter PTR2 n=1 Tax=Trifolium pratense TaxID=57577 RepID=A0A2K3NMN6_TRIPR|nr:peptide transporter PTR2 [Trifolium pratense]